MESKENKEQIEEKFQAKLQGLLEMAKKKKMVIEDTEISISLYDGEDFTIEFNHFRSIKGFFDKDDHIEIKENTLNEKENILYNENNEMIGEVLKQLLIIHKNVYQQ